ncbi:hypothetical protein CDL12_22658 [Handroanthus impetiginosus]|uniref:RING-type E3 ubiquitin transferase n=1 Tax=Handroanthus impetiginosus TaxID=429701 RepID=A0A2G9GHN2_9LAMI|nr:hypothetical protein CDL12_22658 [Handroanthus impetiginosus]
MSRTSPVILLIIVIVAIGFFILGLLHLLTRCLMKRSSFSSVSQSNRLPDNASNAQTFQRQLQQLFRLHDSGLDQALIDLLPIFYYKDIMGLKEPFDCAICLCEFSASDKLKFLPNCSHAFHIHCIETWLLSNSTCPLCRSLISSGNPMLLSFDDAIEQWSLPCPEGANESFSGSKRVFSVTLGKFRSIESENKRENEDTSSSIDGRRCYSMGAFQYIVGGANLQVELAAEMNAKTRFSKEKFSSNAEINGQKINSRSRGDSFSVSKIWLWSKKGKLTGSSDGNGSFVLPMSNGSSLV